MSANYANKIILAPMVRVCTLPMRLLALEYGADLVYCEEIIDRKILLAQRIENAVLGTIDFVMADGTVVFRTCPLEKGKVIFQLGTSDAKRALAAARTVEKDVAGIDINMGCPKEFSIKGGMGCALLTQPEKVKQILTTLVEGLSIPVTCKIRVLPDLDKTVELAKLIESTKVAALAVHGRTKDERPQHPNRNHVIQAIASAVAIPVIANGGSREILQFEDIEKFRNNTGASSVMIARAAEWNCSIFRREGMLPLFDVVRHYLQYAFKYDNNEINTKYCLLQMMHESMDTSEGLRTLSVRSMEEISAVWKMTEEYEVAQRDRKNKETLINQEKADVSCGFKHRKADGGGVLIELPVRYDRRCYRPATSPKQSLHEWCRKCCFMSPVYKTEEHVEDRSFNCRVLVDDKWYTTPFWEKKKQFAEQAAAMCCLLVHGIHDGRIKEPDDQTPEMRKKWHHIASTHIPENAPLVTTDTMSDFKRQNEPKEFHAALEVVVSEASHGSGHLPVSDIPVTNDFPSEKVDSFRGLSDILVEQNGTTACQRLDEGRHHKIDGQGDGATSDMHVQKYPEDSKQVAENDVKVNSTADEHPLECYYTADFT